MCGIAGFTGPNRLPLIRRMCDLMAHRGPDDDGFWADDQVCLGHRRLSIVDLAGGHQPMTNEDESLWIVFNGEIYNYPQLYPDLVARGHCFRNRSDTEAILHLYEEYGEDCVQHLRGMFAFAIWDALRQRLFCARDHLGIKPFYYTLLDGHLAFASEAKALLELPGVDRRPDPESFYCYLSLRYVPGEQSIFRGLKRLLPGHTLGWQDGQLTLRRYWQLPDAAALAVTEAQAREQVAQTLQTAIQSQLMADVPLGAYLSGGIDSSLLVALMSRLTTDPVTTLSVTFADSQHDESAASQLVADHLGTRHHPLRAEGSLLADLPRIAWHLDEPLADAAVLPTYRLAQLTKPQVTVVLSGEGADECFAGYDQLKLLRPVAAWGPWLSGLARMLQPLAAGWSTGRRALAALAHYRDLPGLVLEAGAYFTPAEKSALLGPAVRENLADYEAHLRHYVTDLGGSDGSLLQRLLRFYLYAWLPDDLLTKVDRTTMAHAIEARVPYLDHKLVELAFSLPDDLRVRGRTDKLLLRQLAAEVLPPEIVQRPKHGFKVPLERWLADHPPAGRPHVWQALADEGLIDAPAWQAVAEGTSTDSFAVRQRRALFFFEQWYRAYYL